MNTDFELGRRYERAETLAMLSATHDVDDGRQLRRLLLLWEQELLESTPPIVVEDTYIVFV
jgi:hypothetical protein